MLELFILSSMILLSHISNSITLCCILGSFFPLATTSFIFISSVFHFHFIYRFNLREHTAHFYDFYLVLFHVYPCLFYNCPLVFNSCVALSVWHFKNYTYFEDWFQIALFSLIQVWIPTFLFCMSILFFLTTDSFIYFIGFFYSYKLIFKRFYLVKESSSWPTFFSF